MKIIIDIPDGYVGIIMSNQRMEGSAMDKMIRQAIIDGTPLEEELKAIKEDMKDTFYDYKNNRYDVSMDGVLDVIDKHISELKGE